MPIESGRAHFLAGTVQPMDRLSAVIDLPLGPHPDCLRRKGW